MQEGASEQTDCNLTGTCPTPTPGPVDPTPTPAPGTGEDPSCPDGHICSPVPGEVENPTEANSAYGWYVHCNQPDLATCERIVDRGNYFDYFDTDPSMCDLPQSAEANAIVAKEGYDRIPGVFYDFTEMCGDPDPDPGPGPGPSTPTPSPTEGCVMDPSLGMNAAPSPDDYGVYQWTYGNWSENGAACGQQTTDMTREFGCVAVVPVFTGPPMGPIGRMDGIKLPGEAQVLQASYGSNDTQGVTVNGVYYPAGLGVRFEKVQFSNGGSQDVMLVPTSLNKCMSNLPAACNRYSGTKANCGYVGQDDPSASTDWTLPGGAPGSATCSAYAERRTGRRCVDAGGAQVDNGFCENNIVNGGGQDYTFANNVEVGNFSGCTARWVGIGEDMGCSTAGNSAYPGPNHFAYYEYSCVRSDGKILNGSEASACTEPKPSNGAKQVGACRMEYEAGMGVACINIGNGSGFNYGYEQLNNMGFPHMVSHFEGSLYDGGMAACAAAGATCCSQRTNDDDNGVSTGLRGRVTTIGTDDEPHGVYGRWIDTNGMPEIDYGTKTYHGDGSVTVDESTRYWTFPEHNAYVNARGGKPRYVQEMWGIPNDDPDPNGAEPGSDQGPGGPGVPNGPM